MDVQAFTLTESQRIYQRAGISLLFPSPAASPDPQPMPSPHWEAVSKRLPPHALAVITYRELGDDLSGSSDPLRSQFFKRLLHTVSMRKGTFAFVPFAFPDSMDTLSDLRVFFDTLKGLSARLLIVFGEFASVPEDLSEPACLYITPRNSLFLPALSTLIQDEANAIPHCSGSIHTFFSAHGYDHS